MGTVAHELCPSRDAIRFPGRGRRLLRPSRVALLLLGVSAPLVAFASTQSREALERAAALVEQGRLQEADQQAQLALSDPQTRAAACSVLGAIRLRQDRVSEGAELLQEAIRLEPRLVGAQLNLAQAYSLQGKEDQAVPVFRRVLELDPANATARIALARSETEKGNYKRSLELAKPVMAEAKESPEGLLVLVTAYLKTGDAPSARALVKDAKRLADAPPVWSAAFAERLVRGGLVGEGIDVLESARKAEPTSYELAFALGSAFVVKPDPARALEAYDAALALKPDSLAALRQAAVVAERNGELERSLSYWMRAKKLAADDAEVLLGFGRVCLKMDLLDDAEAALESAAARDPGDPASAYTLAVAKVGKRQYEAAQTLLEPLVKKRPQDAQLQYALGSVLYMQGHLAEADERLRESLRLDADQLASPYYLALVARDQGKDAEAASRLEELLHRHPDHASSCEALGGLMMNARRYDEAERLLRKAVELNPKSVKANYQLGLLLARTGRKEEADKQLALAKSLREEDDKTSRLQLRLLEPEG